MVGGLQKVTAQPKEILNGPVHREKPLRVGGGFEPPHLVFPLPGRLVGDFRTIVRVSVRTVDHRRHHGPAGRGVTSQLVGDKSSGDAALPFQQLSEEAYGRSPIAPGLHQHVDHIAVFIHGPPQVLQPPVDLHEDLVQIPRVAQATPAAPQPPRVVEPERPTPLSNRLIRHRDTPFGEEILDISEAETETMVEPDGVTDNLALLKFVWVTLARFTSAMTDQAVSGSTTGRRVRCESGSGFWAASMCLEPALWKLTVPWTHRPRPPRLGKRRTFSTSFHRA